MALRIPIPAATWPPVSTASSCSASCGRSTVAQTATQLADLLDAHHYTDGLAFVRPGTPTNNTDDRRAGYSSQDPGHARSFAIEVDARLRTLDDNNALRVGTALGSFQSDRSLTLGRIDRGSTHDDLDMRSMNTALWQVGLGLFPQQHDRRRGRAHAGRPRLGARHFLDHVRSFGPFPTLRCGAQPYGILPVTSLDLWQPGETETGAPQQDSWLKEPPAHLRDNVWRPPRTPSRASATGRTRPTPTPISPT